MPPYSLHSTRCFVHHVPAPWYPPTHPTVYCIKAQASCEQPPLLKMIVSCNAFAQICSSGSGQWYNDIAFSVTMPHTLLFTGKAYVCNLQRAIREDGQWNEVRFAFSRLGNRDMNQWSTEQCLCISEEYWILNCRTPTAPTMRVLNAVDTPNGVFWKYNSNYYGYALQPD